MISRAVFVVALVGCSSGRSEPTTPTPGEPHEVIVRRDAGVAATPDAAAAISSTDPSCDDRVAAFRTASMPRPLPPPPNKIVVAKATAWRDAERPGVMVTVAADGAFGLDGETLDARTLEHLLVDLVDYSIEEQGEGPVALYVVADAAAPVRAVKRVLGFAPEGTEPRLVVEKDPLPEEYAGVVVTPSAAPWVHEWFATVRDRDERIPQQELADALLRALGEQCPQMAEAYRQIAESNPGDRAGLEETVLADALAACDCAGVDPGFEFLSTLFDRKPWPWGWVSLAKLPGGLAKRATVADLVAALAAP